MASKQTGIRTRANPAGALAQVWGWVMMGAAGFTDKAFTSNPGTMSGLRWSHPTARRLRYEVYWALYEANVYSRIHEWADGLKDYHDLYGGVRSLYSPAYRIGEFWAEHVWGGELDKDAGDGTVHPSALPILTGNPALRPALAQLWADSHWQARKDTGPRFGAMLGDVAICVDDDPRSKTVCLRVIHPSVIERVTKDSRGNVKGYVFQEYVPDPEWVDPTSPPPPILKTEVCQRSGDRVWYETLRAGEPYDWRTYDDGDVQVGASWSEDYGFVPLVVLQNRDMGLGFGWAEIHPTVGKMLELDMAASKLDDQLFKVVDAPFLFSGMKGPEELDVDLGDDGSDDGSPSPSGARWDGDEPRAPGRYPALYASDVNAKASPLVAPLEFDKSLLVVTGLLTQIEKDHPELLADIGDTSSNVSGEAIGKAREKVERRVVSRRASYDEALVRAQMMALSIGGMKQYPGYEAFNKDSFARGDLRHSIGHRPVFAVDAAARVKEAGGRATVLKTLTDAGVPLRSAMMLSGYATEAVDQAMAERTTDDAAALDRAKTAQSHLFGETGTPSGDGGPGA